MALAIPAHSTQRHEATALEYKAKKTFIDSGARAGSYMTQAVVLVYDDILRFQTGPNAYFKLNEVADFNFDYFKGNSIWFMDELVGMESDWKYNAEAAVTSGDKNLTAYGFVQFTKDTVETAVNRYIGHIKRFNIRKDNRGWQPWAIPAGSEMQIPFFVNRIKIAIDAGKYDHKFELGRLTYDQQIALAFVHLHRETSKDSNFRLLSMGDVDAAKTIYKNNHHTNPKAATLLRLNVTKQPGLDKDGKTIPGTQPGFFRVHYVPAPTLLKFTQGLPTARALTLLYDIVLDQIFSPAYKAKVVEGRVATDLTSDN